MGSQHIYLFSVMALLIGGLIVDKLRPSYTFLIAVFLLVVGGIIPTTDFLASLSNTAVLSIFLLIMITSGVNEHFQLNKSLDKMFGKTKSPKLFMFQFGTFVTGLSAIMNNTPVVAMLMPYISDWSKKHSISPSKFFIPLSFFAISGGMITLIGTSTNMVLQGLIQSNTSEHLQWIDFLIPGLIVSLITVIYLVTLGYKLLPDLQNTLSHFQENKREYLVETIVSKGSSLVGKNIEQAGLRNLKDVYLVEIMRQGRLITPVKPNELVCEDDLLFFAGDTSMVIQLLNHTNGLEISKKDKLDLSDHPEMMEAVIPYNSLLSGKNVKQFGFRERYDGAIVGIHRGGAKISGKIGDIPLETGDLLLVAAGPDFRKLVDKETNLYIVSAFEKTSKVSQLNKNLFLIGLAFCVVLAALPASFFGIERPGGLLKLYEALFLILGLQFAFGMMDSAGVKKNVSLDLLIILASALTVGSALVSSGASQLVADVFISYFIDSGLLTMSIALFALTVLLTSFITNVAAVSIIFPITLSISETLGISGLPLFMVAAFGASACYITPMGYQTNLMVMGPGGYKFNHFVRVGLPLTLLYAIVVIGYLAIKYEMKF